MNRWWLIGGALVLVLAGVIGWLNASADARLEAALILADVTTPGCTGRGQVHLVLGNASDRPIARVDGVISVASAPEETPVPVGNFELAGPVAPRRQIEACVSVGEVALSGQEPDTLLWMARATRVEFAEPR